MEKFHPRHSYSKPRPSYRSIRVTKLRLYYAVALIITLIYFLSSDDFLRPSPTLRRPLRPEQFPIADDQIIDLPRGRAKKLPKIQYAFGYESRVQKKLRKQRLAVVKENFLHSWKGYKDYAWAKDELAPCSKSFKTPFCGWAATMVDSLDTLWIMDLKEEFVLAVDALKDIDFTTAGSCTINLFETTIRHLGGLLSAYDLSGGKYPILLEKSLELADVLFSAFDTPNRMVYARKYFPQLIDFLLTFLYSAYAALPVSQSGSY